MPDYTTTTSYAVTKGLNFTGPLSHDLVVSLAEAWQPEVRYHEEERFHPVDLAGLYILPAQVFNGLSQGAQDNLTIVVNGATFAPPVIRNGNDVIGSGDTATTSLESTDVRGGTITTHGASFSSSNEIFGSTSVMGGAINPAPGVPRIPRHTIIIRAEMRMLFETLRHQLDLLSSDKPDSFTRDGIWGDFDVYRSFFIENEIEEPAALTSSQIHAVLQSLVDSFDPDNRDPVAETAAFQAADALLQNGWSLDRTSWDVIKNFAFMEYHFIYSYNDYDRYQTTLGNYHEGDNEGCCVVFDRVKLDQMVQGGAATTAESIPPAALITSVHEEWQGGDRLDANISVDPVRARDDLVVYVARGSHATYLEPGEFDVLDFGDAFFTPFHGPGWTKFLFPLLPVAGILFAIYEHFVDTEDKTSSDGASSHPPNEDITQLPLAVETELVVTELSDINDNNDRNIYTSGTGDLGIRGFPGVLGAHNGTVNHSPAWENKTARYYRRLLRAVKSGAIRLDEPIVE